MTDQPIQYRHRLVAALESIRDGQRSSFDAFRDCQSEFVALHRQTAAAEADDRRESMRQHERDAGRNLERLGDIANGIIGVSEAVAESGERTVAAIERMSHQLGYELAEVKWSLHRVEIKADDMNRWLMSIAGSSATLVDLLRRPAEVRALELANQSRIHLAVGRPDEALALAERAHRICPTSTYILGHLILVLCVHRGHRDAVRIRALTQNLARLIVYQRTDPQTDTAALRSECAAALPSVLNALGRIFGRIVFDEAADLLADDVLSLVIDDVLLKPDMAELFDTPTLLGELFWWQAYHLGVDAQTRPHSTNEGFAPVARFLERIASSPTQAKPVLESECAARIYSAGLLGDLLADGLSGGDAGSRHAIRIWIRDGLSEAHVKLPPEQKLALLAFVRRHGGDEAEPARGILYGYEAESIDAVQQFHNLAKGSFRGACAHADAFLAWLESEIQPRRDLCEENERRAAATREALAPDLIEAKEREAKANSRLRVAEKRYAARDKVQPGAGFVLGAFLGLLSLFARSEHDAPWGRAAGVLCILLVAGDLVCLLYRLSLPRAVSTAKAHRDASVRDRSALDKRIGSLQFQLGAERKSLEDDIARRLSAVLVTIDEIADEVAQLQRTTTDRWFGRYSSDLEQERDAFAARCVDGIDFSTQATRCREAARRATAAGTNRAGRTAWTLLRPRGSMRD